MAEKLYVVERGPGDAAPPLVLLHGFPESHRAWDRVAPHLPGFRLLIPDLRGYGRSPKPRGVDAYRLDALAEDVLGVAPGPLVLVGHDWGGVAAWWAAARAPERVAKLIILNAPHPAILRPYFRRHPRQVARSWYVFVFQVPGLGEAIFRAIGPRIIAGSARPGAFSAEDFAAYRREWAAPGTLPAMIDWYRAAFRLPAPAAPRIRVPTLLLWGDRDTFLGRSMAEASAALCDDVRVRHFPDLTHWLHREDPETVAAAIKDFVAAP